MKHLTERDLKQLLELVINELEQLTTIDDDGAIEPLKRFELLRTKLENAIDEVKS